MADLDQQIRAWLEDNVGTHDATDAATAAVHAVLDVHKPEQVEWRPPNHLVCSSCLNVYEESADYPCETVKAIARKILPEEETDRG